MTDNDDPDPPPGPSSAGGNDEPDEAGTRKEHTIGRARKHRASRLAPTDPEVPSAKRRGALRHQRSLVGLTVVVMGLLSITLALLYRASQQVRTHDESTELAPSGIRSERSVSPHIDEDTRPPSTSPSPRHSVKELLDQAPADVTSNDSAPATSASAPKGPPPALDIIRTPTF